MSHLLQIMYCPAAYCHPIYLAESLRGQDTLSNVLINYWLIEHYQLKDLSNDWSPSCITASLIISNWQRLVTIAHLIGGYLLRSQLLRRGAVLATDARLQSFISLPLAHNIIIEESDSEFTTTACGATFIMALASQFPEALHQRLKLCFPDGEKRPECRIVSTPEHINLLKIAITYANN